MAILPTLAPNPQQTSPDAIAMQRAYAKALLESSMSDKPIGSWTQGVSGMVDALVGGLMSRKAGEREAAGEQSANDVFTKMLIGGIPAGNGMVPGATPQASAPSSPDPISVGGVPIAPASPGAVGGAPAVSTPAAAGAPAISREQIIKLFNNPFASPAQKAMALELWKAQMPAPPKPEEPYTLKPGEHRFLGGREVANVPEAAPEKWVDLPPDANGAVYQRSEKTGELREGIKGSTPGEKWIDLPLDAQGNLRQRNERTGEIRQAVAGDVKSPAAFDQAKALAEAGRTQITNNVGPTGIDYGEPEKGYAWKRDKDGKVVENAEGAPVQVRIGGGSLEAAAADAAKKEAAGATQKAAYSDITTQNIDDAAQLIREHPQTTTGAIGGQILSHIGGTPAFNVAKKLAVITANNAFDRLAKLRESGGTLGQVTTFEEKMLSDGLGSLDQAQTSDELLKALDRVKSVYTAIATVGIKPGDPLAAGAAPPATPPAAAAKSGGRPIPGPDASPQEKADYEAWKAEMQRRGLPLP